MNIREIPGEALTWWIDSRSEPGKQHRVDWLSTTPNCTCNSWSMKRRAHLEQTGKPYLCAHLIACRDHCWDKMREDIRDQILST
jgi:hypothetical protein